MNKNLVLIAMLALGITGVSAENKKPAQRILSEPQREAKPVSPSTDLSWKKVQENAKPQEKNKLQEKKKRCSQSSIQGMKKRAPLLSNS